MSKILILKNDRAGDLFTSLKLISSLIRDSDYLKIYLSELNFSFCFFFNNQIVNKINYDLSIFDRLKVLYDIFINKYDKIFILSPKSFYFLLPFFFRNTKFYAIVYNGQKRDRPNNFFRRYLYKYKIVSRRDINKYSYRQLQEQLLDKDKNLDEKYNNLSLPKINPNINSLIPKNYIFFQYRYKFFDELNWSNEDIHTFLNFLKSKYKNVLFCSDIEKNKRSNELCDSFLKRYSYIDINNNIKNEILENNNIYYLKELSGVDMFHIIKKSSMCIAKEGIVSHICFFHKVKCHNLFNFKIDKPEDIRHQKISYSEWCKGMNYSFSFLNKNLNKTINKIKKQIG